MRVVECELVAASRVSSVDFDFVPVAIPRLLATGPLLNLNL